MYTKRQLIDAAFEELAMAGYVFDIDPDEQLSALRRLDSMMATWGGPGIGIRIGYNATIDPTNSDPDQQSGIPDWANEAVYLNLAIRIASGYGKAVPKSTTGPAKAAYDALLSAISAIPQVQPMGNLPIGAGYKRRFSTPFVQQPVDLLTTGEDGLLDFNGPVPLP
jgi:P22 tail accessory factor